MNDQSRFSPSLKFGFLCAGVALAYAVLSTVAVMAEDQPIVSDAGWWRVLAESAHSSAYYVAAAIWLFQESKLPPQSRWVRRSLACLIWLLAIMAGQTLFITLNRGLPLTAMPDVFAVAFGWRVYVDVVIFAALAFVADAARARWFVEQEPDAVWLEAMTAKGRVRLRTTEITAVTAAANYVEIHTGAKRYLRRDTLDRLEGVLADAGFVRIHRTAMVYWASVREVRKTPSGRDEVMLTTGLALPVSRRRAGDIRALWERDAARP